MVKKEDKISSEALKGIESYITKEVLEKELAENKNEAEELLLSKENLDKFLLKVKRKYLEIPNSKENLYEIPVLIDLVDDYFQNEYIDIPKDSITTIVSALIYFLSPMDLMPDTIPVMGYSDDVVVISRVCDEFKTDIEKYKNHKI